MPTLEQLQYAALQVIGDVGYGRELMADVKELNDGVKSPYYKIDSTQIDRTNKRLNAAIPSRPAPAPPAATAFDGDWSVVIMTQSGGCDRAYRYGVRISNGDVIYDGGGPVDLQGHVYSNGSVRVRVSGAGQQADGQGRLSRTVGTGTWRGQGSLGSCAGVWQAERRG